MFWVNTMNMNMGTMITMLIHTQEYRALSDCEMVIAGGMGQGLFNDLQAAGKKVFMTREVNAQEALRLLLANELDTDTNALCQH